MSCKTPQTVTFKEGENSTILAALKICDIIYQKLHQSSTPCTSMGRNSQKGSIPDFPDLENQKLFWGVHQQL